VEEGDMQFFSLGSGYTTSFVLVLLLGLGASGFNQMASSEKAVKYTCKNETIKVDPQKGVDRKAIYLCDGYTVTWIPKPNANVHKFQIVFQDSPFVGGAKKFDDTTTTWPTMDKFTDLDVFKYTITVNDGPPFDPHVVGGGGIVLDSKTHK
jgi:hypothetical protein